MARPRVEGLTPRELGIMDVLWDRQQVSVQDIQDNLPDRLVDSTIRTLLQIMEDKGYVASWKEGRANMYRPTITRDQVERSALSTMIDRVFGGRPEALLARMVEDEHVDADALEKVRRTLEAR
jgi:predicted transcriptional regulator